jgi:hypothetical protein
MRAMAVGLVAGTLFLTMSPALSDPPPSPSVDIETPGTEEAPGYEDFRDAAPSSKEIEEEQERRDDRNIVSPGMRDDQDLQREMGQE